MKKILRFLSAICTCTVFMTQTAIAQDKSNILVIWGDDSVGCPPWSRGGQISNKEE